MIFYSKTMNEELLKLLHFLVDNIYPSTFTLLRYFFKQKKKKITNRKLENYHEKNSNLEEKYVKVRKVTVTETSRNNTMILLSVFIHLFNCLVFQCSLKDN